MTFLSLDTLDDVKRDFAKWRASRPNKKGKIPNHLWDKVFALLDLYPIGKVTKELGLSGGQVSAKRKQRNALEGISKSSATDNFVEVDLASTIRSNTPLANTFSRIEIRRPDGSVLTIGHLPEQTMMQVLNQFTMAVN
jgi:hypothetical protein